MTLAIVTDVENLFKTIGADAVVAWDEFLKGITWLATEAQAVAAIAEKLDPGLQAQLQALLTAGEAAAAATGNAGVSALVNVIAGVAGDAETSLANASSAAFGGNPLAQGVTSATISTIQQIATAAQNAVPIAAAKLVGAIAAAAAQPSPQSASGANT